MNIPPTTTPRTGSGIGPGAVGALVLDGVGIAPTLILSTTVGVGVALAVIAHDFTDDLTTVALMLLNGNTFRQEPLALLLDAQSPATLRTDPATRHDRPAQGLSRRRFHGLSAGICWR
jgi:hypothetical protein